MHHYTSRDSSQKIVGLLKLGQFGQALELSRALYQANPHSKDIADSYVQALRWVAVSRRVIDVFRNNLGLAADEYHGFDNQLTLPDYGQVLQEIIAVGSDAQSGEVAAAANLLARELLLIDGIDDLPPAMESKDNRYQAGLHFLDAKCALEKGDSLGARLHIIKALEHGAASGPAHLIHAYTTLGHGSGHAAINFFQSSLVNNDTPWFLGLPQHARISEYRNHAIFFSHGEFFAVPLNGRYFFVPSDQGESEVLENRLPASWRQAVLAKLPAPLIDLLRRFLHSTIMRRLFIRPALGRLFHDQDLSRVMSAIDANQTASGGSDPCAAVQKQ